jgi:hypothetical protein
MRVERHGSPPDLQAAFKGMVQRQLCGRALDDYNLGSEGKFPDFACFRNILLIEMKHLETEQNDRVNEVLETKIDSGERPYFLGSRDAQLVIDTISNRETVKSAIVSKLARTIEGLLSKANQQFASYRSRHPRKNSVSICVILNSKLREFSPETVLYAIDRKMKQKREGRRFPEIDAVLYFSEKHYKLLPDGRIGFATGIYETEAIALMPWKTQFVDRVVEAWSQARTGAPAVHQMTASAYQVIEDIPVQLKRYEAWQLEYQRRPYLSAVSVGRLKVLFNRSVAQNGMAFLKGSWPKPLKEEISAQLRFFTHVVEETNRRGVDLRSFAPHLLTPEERVEVYAGLPQELAEKLTGDGDSAPA